MPHRSPRLDCSTRGLSGVLNVLHAAAAVTAATAVLLLLLRFTAALLFCCCRQRSFLLGRGQQAICFVAEPRSCRDDIFISDFFIPLISIFSYWTSRGHRVDPSSHR